MSAPVGWNGKSTKLQQLGSPKLTSRKLKQSSSSSKRKEKERDEAYNQNMARKKKTWKIKSTANFCYYWVPFQLCSQIFSSSAKKKKYRFNEPRHKISYMHASRPALCARNSAHSGIFGLTVRQRMTYSWPHVGHLCTFPFFIIIIIKRKLIFQFYNRSSSFSILMLLLTPLPLSLLLVLIQWTGAAHCELRELNLCVLVEILSSCETFIKCHRHHFNLIN